MDDQYEHALASAIVILDQLDMKPDMPMHERLSMMTFAILEGMKRYERERGRNVSQPSAN